MPTVNGTTQMTQAVAGGRCHAVVIDIERERAHWLPRYEDLPRARAMRSFVRYWPVLCAAYDAWLNHPHADYATRLAAFLVRDAVIASPLTGSEAAQVFERVWERIMGMTPAAPDPAPPQPDTGTGAG